MCGSRTTFWAISPRREGALQRRELAVDRGVGGPLLQPGAHVAPDPALVDVRDEGQTEMRAKVGQGLLRPAQGTAAVHLVVVHDEGGELFEGRALDARPDQTPPADLRKPALQEPDRIGWNGKIGGHYVRSWTGIRGSWASSCAAHRLLRRCDRCRGGGGLPDRHGSTHLSEDGGSWKVEHYRFQ